MISGAESRTISEQIANRIFSPPLSAEHFLSHVCAGNRNRCSRIFNSCSGIFTVSDASCSNTVFSSLMNLYSWSRYMQLMESARNIVPDVGFSSPDISFRSVVLPCPFLPVMRILSPLRMVRFIHSLHSGSEPA